MRKYTINSASFGVFLLLILINGCMDPYDKRNNGPDANNKLYIQFTLPEGTLKTRGVPAEEGENTVNDLTLLFFTPSSNNTGTYVGYYKVPDEDFDEIEENGNTFNLEVKFESGSGMSVSKAYNVLAFANMRYNYLDNLDAEFDNYISMISSMNEQQVKNYTIMRVEGVGTDQNDNTKAMIRSNLPMSTSFSKAENQENVVCDMIRTVSRFDVVNHATGYTFVSASIWNAYPQGSVWDTRLLDISARRLKRYYGIPADNEQKIKGGLYAFENISTNPDIKDEITTCLILGFKPGSEETVHYYRVNISPQVTGQYLLRNNVYQITVTGILGPGAGSEEDAYKSGKMLLDVSINSWDRDEDGLFIRDGENVLAIPSKRVVFGPEGDSRQYYVYTLGTGTLEMAIIDLPEGITAWLGGTGNDLFIKAEPYTQFERKGAIELRFAGMKGIMEIIQTGQLHKYLTLDHVYVADYPAGLEKQNMIGLNPIRVSSSGPWTAEIYNGNFSFKSDVMETTLEGIDGESIDKIFNWGTNTNPKPQTSFVLVSLDEDPGHYRNVIVLNQVGDGGFTLVPENEQVNFDADGNLKSGTTNKNQFTLTTESNLSWTIELLGDNPEAFTYTFDSGNANGNTCTGDGVFTVSPVGPAYQGARTATLKITHNNNQQRAKTIQLHQDSHKLTLSPATLTVEAKGGNSNPVTVTSTVTGETWNAKIVDFNFTNLSGESPKLVDKNGNIVGNELSGQNPGETFRVYMPGIDQHLQSNALPKVEVEVSVNGTTLKSTLYVSQTGVTYTRIYAQTLRTDMYGNWTNNNRNSDQYKTFGKWADEMIDPGNFGTSGRVYTHESIDISPSGYKNVYTNNGVKARIFNTNNGIPFYAGDMLKSVKDDPNTVFIVYEWILTNRIFDAFDLGNDYAIGGTLSISNTIPRKLNTDASVRNTELWKYIFDKGPFNEVEPDNVALYPQHFPAAMAYLTRWPDTFIPLMYAPDASGQPNTGRVLIGVDPTHRIIWIGHKDLFGLDSGGTKPNNWGNDDNRRFLQNLIAWMVNVNNYGDAFNDRFKVPKD